MKSWAICRFTIEVEVKEVAAEKRKDKLTRAGQTLCRDAVKSIENTGDYAIIPCNGALKPRERAVLDLPIN